MTTLSQIISAQPTRPLTLPNTPRRQVWVMTAVDAHDDPVVLGVWAKQPDQQEKELAIMRHGGWLGKINLTLETIR